MNEFDIKNFLIRCKNISWWTWSDAKLDRTHSTSPTNCLVFHGTYGILRWSSRHTFADQSRHWQDSMDLWHRRPQFGDIGSPLGRQDHTLGHHTLLLSFEGDLWERLRTYMIWYTVAHRKNQTIDWILSNFSMKDWSFFGCHTISRKHYSKR